MAFLEGLKDFLKSIFILIYKLFNNHPKSVGENYFTHMFQAIQFSLKSLAASAIFLLHAFFPFLLKHTGCDIISSMKSKCSSRLRSYPDNDLFI